MTKPILIIGKNGKTGRRVEQRLEALGIPTRGVSRTTTPAFDWEDKSTWRLALAGVSAAYITYQPDLAVPGAAESIQELARLAKQNGLQHLVLLSGRGEEGAQNAEKALIKSDVDWNVVRASWFNQNFSESFLTDGVLSGEVSLPVSDVLEPFIDADDIADVVVATLTQTHLRNRVFEITGPELLTFAQCVDEISKVINRPIHYSPITFEAFLGSLKEHGLSEGELWLMEELFTQVLDGRNSHVSNGVEEALGRPATSFQQYIEKVVTEGVWEQPSSVGLKL